MPLTFGVEIEFLAPPNLEQDQVVSALASYSQLPVISALRGQPRPSQWKVVHDGSVSGPGRTGWEVVSPVLVNTSMDQIDKMCSALSRLGAVVNRSCGLHVHIGARDMPLDAIKRLAILYAESELFIDALLPPSRRASNNVYCKSVKANLKLQKVLDAEDVSRVAMGVRQADRNTADRHMKLNLTSYWKHGTVEFRHHSGTIDPEKIKNWVKFCQHLVSTALREAVSIPQPAVAAARPAAPASGPARGSYWAAGRRRRAYYRMLTRPEGATAAEIQAELRVSTPPGIVYHLRRAGSEASGWSQHRDRDRGTVYFLPTTVTTLGDILREVTAHSRPVLAQPSAPASLEALLERLQVPPSECTYWVERAALLNSES